MNKFSVIIPCYNESKNIFKLVEELKDNLSQEIYEIVIIDDKSNDESFEVYKRLEMNNIKIYYNEKNMGQSFSLYKGIQLAKYDTIITIDGDGQNDPKDLNKIINKYLNTINIKLISGVRKNRKDSFSKIIASRVANYIRRLLLKDNCPDTGCSLKIFDKNIFLKFQYFNGIHRFIPSLFEGFGFNAIYIDVNHRKRLNGISNYNNTKRLFKGIIDIVKVKKILKKIN